MFNGLKGIECNFVGSVKKSRKKGYTENLIGNSTKKFNCQEKSR